MELEKRARRVKLLLMDCDGVLTDGRLYFSESGEALKAFHVRDGQGIVSWHRAGFRSGIVSGRDSEIVNIRAEELGIEFVRQGVRDKAGVCREIADQAGVEMEEVAFVGDDSPDIEVMRSIGFAAAVADAVDDARSAAHFVSKKKGGRGAIREIVDLLLSSKR